MAKLLIADDIESERKLIESILVEAGHQVFTCTNGKEVLEVAPNIAPDLIVLDVVMPQKTGFQACRELKKGDLQNVPVVLLTSKTEESDKFWGKKQGASAYLTKPFDTKELLDTIKNLL